MPSVPFGDTPSSFAGVPLFPLPGVVLFPHAVVPLHIFEERYKAMTADALSGNRLIAMALLRPGWEKNYYGRAEIDPVVCVGEILTHESLADGKYNFLLRGVARATIAREFSDKPYRVADLQTLAEIPAVDSQLKYQRHLISEILANALAATLPGAQQFLQMLASALPTPTIADLIAFHLLDDVPTKQLILSDGDVGRRIFLLIDALQRLKPAAKPLHLNAPPDPSWN
jgi:uncharacterized protein